MLVMQVAEQPGIGKRLVASQGMHRGRVTRSSGSAATAFAYRS